MDSLLIAVVVSACLGALIGLIRQWSDQRQNEFDPDFGGVRTFTLWALVGCIGAYLSQNHSAAFLPVALFLIGVQAIVAHWRETQSGRSGSTSFAAMLLTCATGALVQWQHTQAASLVAALTMVMLGVKKPVHAWTRSFTSEDIRATLQFVAITGVILPLAPNRPMGPLGAFNPFSTWLMVVLISGIGLAGYILMRLLGNQAGITLTGIFGGLASSTATTLAFSRRSKEDPAHSWSYALAVTVACTVMLGRVLVTVWVVNGELGGALLLPLAAAAAPGLVFAAWRWLAKRNGPQEVDTVELRNPLSLKTAIKFALLYAAFAFLIKAATQTSWKSSLVPLGFVSGLTDMDAIALLMANGVNDQSVATDLAARAVVAGVVGNSIVKGVMAIALGSRQLRWPVAGVLLATIAAASVVVLR